MRDDVIQRDSGHVVCIAEQNIWKSGKTTEKEDPQAC